jgi:hypothetical protein
MLFQAASAQPLRLVLVDPIDKYLMRVRTYSFAHKMNTTAYLTHSFSSFSSLLSHLGMITALLSEHTMVDGHRGHII